MHSSLSRLANFCRTKQIWPPNWGRKNAKTKKRIRLLTRNAQIPGWREHSRTTINLLRLGMAAEITRSEVPALDVQKLLPRLFLLLHEWHLHTILGLQFYAES